MTWNNKSVESLLVLLRDLALSPHGRFDNGVDLRYCMALGLIGGAATEALLAAAEHRKANFQIPA